MSRDAWEEDCSACTDDVASRRFMPAYIYCGHIIAAAVGARMVDKGKRLPEMMESP